MERGRALEILKYHILVTKLSKLNHLPPADLNTLIIWLGQSFIGTLPKKTSPITLTVILIKLLGNYTRTNERTHILRLI